LTVLNRWRIVRVVAAHVNQSFCASLCKTSEISENFFFAQERGTMFRPSRRETQRRNLFSTFLRRRSTAHRVAAVFFSL